MDAQAIITVPLPVGQITAAILGTPGDGSGERFLGGFLMGLGFNSKVQLSGGLSHVQTEDRGLVHPFIDTVVLRQGQVLHRRSSAYGDLLAAGVADQDALRARVEQQHREVLDALRGGSLPLEETAVATPAETAGLTVKLCNAGSWLAAGKASLEILVSGGADGGPLAGAEVEVSIEGAGPEAVFSGVTGEDGRSLISFVMPGFAEPEAAALVIRARSGQMHDQVRYRLKARAGRPQ
jgi:hypothetical protein